MNKNVQEERAADYLVNVKDIREHYLYTKDNQIVMMAKLGKINIDNLSEREKAIKANILASNFKVNKKCFDILSIPQTIDMEPYIQELSELYNKEVNFKKRYVLSEKMKQAKDIMMDGRCYEHQKYFIIFEEISGNREKAETTIKHRMYDFKKIFFKLNIGFEILDKPELITVCNLFNNGEFVLMYQYGEYDEELPFSVI